ncbi:hypothetical protein [Aureibacter tunicatorum]|uniref:Uncharacterized protein n=1 Tax=Aureibacter tunicatorum TaxID=866807 RepID=A0AAE3XKF3_9BACT|nr:hypothetical protein [Aureibacter tunicatorum]MDR6237376.1 hypothetical protein [Aureibacter tunicatorum]
MIKSHLCIGDEFKQNLLNYIRKNIVRSLQYALLALMTLTGMLDSIPEMSQEGDCVCSQSNYDCDTDASIRISKRYCLQQININKPLLNKVFKISKSHNDYFFNWYQYFVQVSIERPPALLLS